MARSELRASFAAECGIGARIESDFGVRQFVAQRRERRGGEPDVLLPNGRAFAGRHDGVAAGRVNLRRTSAGDHADVGVAADDGDAADARRNDGKHGVAVLQENDAVFFDVLGDVQSLLHVDHAFLRRIVDDAGEKLGIEDAARMIVNFRERHAAGVDGILELGAKPVRSRLLLVKTGR